MRQLILFNKYKTYNMININPFILQNSLADGLVAYWMLDGNANDSGVNNYTGILQNTPVSVADKNGTANHAYSFNPSLGAGTGAKINFGNITSLNNIPSLTVSAWVKLDSLTSGVIIGKLPLTGGVFLLSYESSVSKFRFNCAGSLESSIMPSTGIWYNIIATHSNNGVNKIYINGVFNVSYATTTTTTSTDSVVIGSSAESTFYQLRGAVDNVRIYNRVLTDLEIANIYTNYL